MALLAAVPAIEPKRRRAGSLKVAKNQPQQCACRPPAALTGTAVLMPLAVCAGTVPPLAEVGTGHWVACHRSHEALIPLSLPA